VIGVSANFRKLAKHMDGHWRKPTRPDRENGMPGLVIGGMASGKFTGFV